MKKTLTLFIFCIFTIHSFSQQTSDNKSNSEIDIQTNAENWFKDVYVHVEDVFNDPYSYKHLKTTIIPKTIDDFLNKKLLDINTELDNDKSGYGYERVDPKIRLDAEDFYNQLLSKIERLTKLIKKESDATNYNKKSRDVNIKLVKLVLNHLKRTNIHNLNVDKE